ncbi:MAG: SDR family oxidoreductase [Syntrophales bacterium]|nr:SDR family oxidoreductase [Syntrophales bacterium]
MEITGKVTVVTGAGSGIGAALTRRFIREGAQVVAADINEESVVSVATDTGAIPFRCDVSREQDVIDLIDFTEKNVGPITLFCSNAGIAIKGGVECTNDDWQRIWEINVMSHVYVSRALIPRMAARGGGAIMITASAAGLLSQIGSAPYSVTKHAAVGLAENLYITYGEQGIKIFALCPQAVRTAMAGEDSIAAVDGLMEPEELAEKVIEGLKKEEFLILPHPEVRTYMQRKAADYDRWLRGMQRLQARYLQGLPLKGGS